MSMCGVLQTRCRGSGDAGPRLRSPSGGLSRVTESSVPLGPARFRAGLLSDRTYGAYKLVVNGWGTSNAGPARFRADLLADG